MKNNKTNEEHQKKIAEYFFKKRLQLRDLRFLKSNLTKSDLITKFLKRGEIKRINEKEQEIADELFSYMMGKRIAVLDPLPPASENPETTEVKFTYYKLT